MSKLVPRTHILGTALKYLDDTNAIEQSENFFETLTQALKYENGC